MANKTKEFTKSQLMETDEEYASPQKESKSEMNNFITFQSAGSNSERGSPEEKKKAKATSNAVELQQKLTRMKLSNQ